ncbi:MAG: UDP-N-acetylmuramoyl-L-alanine--D-glutamate ligase [Bacteroidia bacterium]|nr:UDP-N-acetylmuramoyl-L-alanine--D-glutamate ligase [Bacteroidia bacterium]MDW8088962.1 UDP-N-acetylmuramoyl-L-alanine--D-glutamate ligase [Bacteroidia bacterium]
MSLLVGVWGLGASGVGAALLGKAKGYDMVLVAEESPTPERSARLQQAGLSWVVQEDPYPVLRAADLIVRSPGIPPTHSTLQRLLAEGKRVISDLEWGWRHLPPGARLWLVTGSAGKSSTTHLLTHLLHTAGRRAVACGNIGYSFCQALVETQADYFVVEASSFQLRDTLTLIPNYLVLTSLVPNHLDWHGSWRQYVEDKLHILRRLPPTVEVIQEAGSPYWAEVLPAFPTPARVWRYRETPGPGIHAWLENSKLVCDMETLEDSEKWEVSYEGTPLVDLPQRKNSLAAAIVARLEGLRRADLRRTFETLQRLPHRLEPVDMIQGVLYVNDSKATTTDAVWYALQSFQRPIIWIAGGVDKGNDWGELLSTVRAKVRALIVIGRDTRRLEEAFQREVPVLVRASSMDAAVQQAHALARPGDVVLLSPACASFDWFASYEARGQAFREAVQRLKEAYEGQT